MKKLSHIIISFIVILIGSISNAERVDLLKPEYQRQEQELRRIMEQSALKGLSYSVVVEDMKYPTKTYPHFMEIKVKTVRIPGDIEKKVSQYNQRFIRWNFVIYLENPKYSFYAGILSIRCAFLRGIRNALVPDSVSNHDQEQWGNEFTSELKERFILLNGRGSPRIAELNAKENPNVFKMNVSEFVPLEAYYGAVLFPAEHIEDALSAN